MSNLPFHEWVRGFFYRSGMSLREFEARTHFRRGTLAEIVDGKRKPTLKFCEAFSKCFDVSLQHTLYAAGITDSPPYSPESERLILLYQQADPKKQQIIIEFVEKIAYGD